MRVGLERFRVRVYQYESRSVRHLSGRHDPSGRLVGEYMEISNTINEILINIDQRAFGGDLSGLKFKGTNIYPEKKISLIPSAGIKIQKNHYTFRADLEYFNTEFYRIGPIWVKLGFSYNHFLSRIRTPGKTIKWY